MGSKIGPYTLIFCPQVEEKKRMQPKFIKEIIFITRIRERKKRVFRVLLYESIWPDFNIKTVICSSMLIHTKTLTQKALLGQ